jgi:photosystem II stability/assembly factor-like uncharacterized protein
MERRTFLKLATSTIVAAAGRLALPGAAAAAGRDVLYAGSLYRAGGAGKILTSADGGLSWALHSDLGDMYSISKLAVDRLSNRLRLTVGYAGSTFPLVLAPDKRSWRTA